MDFRLLLAALLVGAAHGARIADSSPYWLGYGGGISLFISGTGFSEDQFSHFDTTLGNKVKLVNEVDTVDCEVIPYLTNTEKIVCVVGQRLNVNAPSVYVIKVFADGVEASGSRTVEFASWMSPVIERMNPRWALPGEFVEMTGYMQTDRFQVVDLNDPLEDDLSSGRVMTGAYVGKVECEMVNETTGVLHYPLNTNSLKCKVLSQNIGPMNGSVYVTTRGAAETRWYGMYSDSQDKLYQYHTYAGVESVSPSTGSPGGSTLITVTGVGFSNIAGATEVRVGGAVCDIQSVSYNSLTCLTPAQDTTSPGPRERGFLWEFWEGAYPEIWNDAQWNTLDSTHPNYTSDYKLDINFNVTMSVPSAGKLSGYLNMPHDGNYSFGFHALNASVRIYIAANGNPANLTFVNYWEKVFLYKDTPAYFEIRYRGTASTIFRGLMNDFAPKYSRYQTHLALDEKQRLYLNPRVKWDKQRLTPSGTLAAASLYLNGFLSPPVNVSDASKVRTAVLGLVDQQCEDVATDPTISTRSGFEIGSEDPPGRRGSIVDDVKPFCGRYSFMVHETDPKVYDQSDDKLMVDVLKFNYVCFAIKGNAKKSMKVEFYWWDKWNRWRSDAVWFDHTYTSDPNTWSYQCHDIFKVMNSSSINTQRNKGAVVKARRVWAPLPHSSFDDVYVDEFMFSDESVGVTQARPSALQSQGILISNITVTPVVVDGVTSLDVEFITSNCYGNFPLLGVTSGAPNPSWLTELDSSATDASFTVRGGTVNVTRLVTATNVISGTWSMDIMGATLSGLAPDVSPHVLEEMVNGALGTTGIDVRQWGTCNTRKWTVEWLEDPGPKPLITVDDSQLVFDGDSFSFTVSRDQDGRLWHDPIVADFVIVHREEPHVSVTVNGYSAACLGDCSYAFDASGAPTLSSVAGSMGVSGEHTLTIMGSGFTSSDMSSYSVTVGGVDCVVSAVATTTVTCTASYLPAGVHSVNVVMQPIGAALQPNPALTYTVTLSVTSVTPATGGTGGGYSVIVLGSGFPADLDGWSGNSVTLGGVACDVTAADGASVTCTVPAGAAGSVDVSVTISGQTSTLTSGFTYDSTLSASITTVSPTTSNVLGGSVLSITGTGFGDGTGGYVKVGPNTCGVVSWTGTLITCTLPSNNPGVQAVSVYTGSQGFASGSASVTYTFKITGSSSATGSVFGGTILVLDGEGFGTDCSLLEVEIGDGMVCDVLECSDVQITCITRLVSVNHVVTNMGIYPGYGTGFAWSPKVLTITEGDSITWNWSKPDPLSQALFSIFQTATAADKTYDGSGFNSGAPMSSGSYTVEFPHAGTFFYAGSPVTDAEDALVMTGQINVVKPSESVNKITVELGEIEAEYDPLGTTPSVSVDGCPSLISTPIDGCTSTAPSAPDAENLYFISDLCLTPTITGVSASAVESIDGLQGIQVRTGVTLTITGTGFGTTDCQSSVKIGPASCTVTASTDTSITCNLDDSSNVVSLKAFPVTVTVANRGAAAISVSNFVTEGQVTVVPVVSSFTPTEGSVAGGTLITITGSGLVAFDNQVAVPLGSGSCAIESLTATAITCSTPPTPASSSSVAVFVSAFNIQAISDLASSTYTFSASATPMVSDVSVSGDTVTITGSSFGTSTSGVTVTITVTPTRRKRSLDEDIPAETKKREVRYQTYFDDDDEMHVYDEEAKVSRSTRRPKISSDLFDPLETESGFWGRFTNTDAKTFEESVRLGAWRVAGSNSQYVKKLQAAHEERVLRQKRQTSPVTMTYSCTVTSVTSTSIQCTASGVPANTYSVDVNVAGLGTAQSSVSSFTVSPVISSISPVQGSTNGGALLTISGSGFTPGQVSVTLDSVDCPLESEAANSLSCRVPPHAAGAVSVVVMSSSVSATSSTDFTYASAVTPILTSVSPDSSVSPGMTLTLTGSGFKSSATDPTVMIGEGYCTITSASDTSIVCTSPDVAGGSHSVVVRDAQYGDSNSDITVSYDFTVTTVSPTSGGFGGAAITITGLGFDPSGGSVVTVCGNPCSLISSSSSTIDCLAPPYTAGGTSVPCDIIVTNPGSATATLSSGFTYDQALTPAVTSVSPKRGGTAGGTVVTITGTGFSVSGNEVSIDGSPCIVSSETTTEIICETEPHAGPGTFRVAVKSPGLGMATTDENAEFFYIDRWSSIYTWGGNPVPSAGQLVVITKGQTILLDQSTDVIGAIIIQGGHLVFDDEAASELILRSKYILIVDGGSLSIGSEEEPFLNNAVIELHGNTQDIELPLYGAKVLAVRNGTLDLHGAHIPITWTHLATTANPGDLTITLKQPVTWKAGDQIIIATTEHRFMVNENEKRTIASVSGDGLTVTLTEALQYEHISIQQTIGGRNIETRAEVGLLTRNVKVRGNINTDFSEVIEACDEQWNPGQFETQSCFDGRFGEEMGSDQFGATVMIFSKFPNQDLVAGRIEYVEVTEAGQAFNLGRYPLHFHLVGNVNTSYIRGCAVHRTYNRAVTIHAADYLTIERNVVYNNMGHAIFTEDGIEQNNVIQYNLAVYTRTSSSLLNVDVTPSSYWVVNPNNIVRHNAAAGGTHFGYWYRLERNPSGPSATTSYCQNNAVMGEFTNNTAHSIGRYGLWVFSMDGYFPKTRACGGSDLVAKWHNFTVWRCDRGAEVVFGGNLQFHGFVTLDNEHAGLEMVKMQGNFGEDDGPGIFDSLVIGHSALSPGGCGDETSGIIAPKQNIFSIADTKFVNFDTGKCSALSGCSQCKFRQGGFQVQVKGLTFENSPNKMRFQWEYETIWIDADGSLTGQAENVLVPSMGILPPSSCQINVTAFSVNPEAPGSVCTGLKFLRFNVKGPNIKPDSLQGKEIIVSNAHGSTRVPYRIKRLTTEGWMGILPTGDNYQWEFNGAQQITNLTYDAEVRLMENGNYFFVSHEFIQRPDSFGTLGTQRNSTIALPDPNTNVHGDYYWNNDTMTMTYMVSSTQGRRRRTVFDGRVPGFQRNIKFQVYRCYFENCITPTPPPVPTGRPDTTFRWSDTETWKEVPVGSGGHPTEGTYGLPVAGDEIIVPPGMWLIVDIATPPLARVYVYGAIEFEDTMHHTFSATIIYLQGGSVVAGFSEDAPFTHNLNIVLRGSLDPTDPDNVDMPMPMGVPSVGWKAIGVFGQLTLHGVHAGSAWAKLGATAAAGATQVTLAEAADPSWVGKEVMITTTSKEALETEIKTVTAVSGSTLTLNTPLEFDHLGESFTLSDGTTSFTMAGEVGILSRNIRIEGNDYPDLQEDSFGGRIVVSKMNVDGVEYVGQVQLSNVELKNMGQEGFTDVDDPRYSLAFVGLGVDDGSNYVKRCSFNKNYNTAVGMFGTDNVTIEDNVIYHTVGPCIRDDSSDNTYRGNLLSVMLFPGTYNGRFEDQNLDWFGAFALNKAMGVVLENNVVAGSEQAGYQTFGEPCEDATLWQNNEVHGAIYGVMIWRKGSGAAVDECRRISNVYAWRAWDTAFYMQDYSSFLLSNVKAVDSRVGAVQIAYAPHSLTHQFLDKTAVTEDSVFVGASPFHTCDYQASTPAIHTFQEKHLWRGGINGGHSGIVFASFVSVPNMAPKHGFADADSYPALHGGMFVRNTVFANYGTRSCGTDVALITNPTGDDGIHPIFTSGLTFINTASDHYMFMQEPNLARINPSDCVDMDCDGLKKIVVTDLDGTLLGSADATATSMAEFEWDGDRSRGVGDYRIPVALKQNPDGSAIPASAKFPNKGIVRDASCSLVTAWRAWKCTALRHRMMIIESMDSDTEIRRLSPIALIANPGTNGYVDLINGPMDRGWCFGYTCQERISTFYTIVASTYTYEMGMTSTPPQVMRLHLLHSDASETVLLRIFFPKMQRYDVYVDGTLVKPTNIDTSSTAYKLLPVDPNNPQAFYPTHSDPVGSNFLERSRKMLHVLLKGGHMVQIKTRPMVVLSTGAVVSESDFYEENLVANVAAMLGISPDNIVVTNIVRETSGRHKREATVSFTATFEVSSAPTTTATGTDSAATGQLLSYDQLSHSVANLVNSFQGDCPTCSMNLLSLEVEDPIPPPEPAGEHATEASGSVIIEGGQLYSNVKQEQENAKLNQSLQATVYEEPSGSTVEEGVPVDNVAFTPFAVQPVITVHTSDGGDIEDLGYASEPWEFQAVLSGGPPGAVLMGTTIVPYRDGSANFTNLAVNRAGEGYTLSFVIASPHTATVLNTGLGYTFRTAQKPVSLRIVSQPAFVNAKTDFYLDFVLFDEDAGMAIDPALLTGQTLNGKIQITNKKKDGKLLGNTKFTLTDGDISQFTLGPFQITVAEPNYRLQTKIEVTPAGWSQAVKTDAFPVLPQDLVIPEDAITKKISMKGLWGKSKVLKGNKAEFLNKLNSELNEKVGGAYYFDFELRGSKRPLALLKAMGSPAQLDTALETLCDALKNQRIKVRIERQKFVMGQLRVDGKRRKRCDAPKG
ncbi:fibrocystin-L-like [Macrobrachium nipponense]|uniref:fibrocystin-L-like n=1 Tax=Macrobrachium nipponense TaxID=159736 RepID=UPI0030C8C53F